MITSKTPTFPTIEVVNRQRARVLPVDKLQGFAELALRRVLKIPKRKSTALQKLEQIFVWLISDRTMSVLHRRHMRVAGPTDVLTFEHGEIFVSVETARRNALSFRNSLTGEISLYIVHGLLHLHGFDDRAQKEAHGMQQLQEKIVTDIGR